MNKLLYAGIFAFISVMTGCASIVDGKYQTMTVETLHKEKTMVGAVCKLSNNKGNWFLTSPGTTTVQRSYENLTIRCEKEGIKEGVASVESSTKAMAFGNIIFGGFVGAGVDMATGSAYDYPNSVAIDMGETTLIASQAQAERKTFTIAPDKSGIYVFRSESIAPLVKMDVAIDGQTIGRTAAKTYLFKEVSPGKHIVSSSAENTDTLEVEAKPGTLTYVWQEVKMGVLFARTKLHPVSEEEGRKGVRESSLVVSK